MQGSNVFRISLYQFIIRGIRGRGMCLCPPFFYKRPLWPALQNRRDYSFSALKQKPYETLENNTLYH